MKRRWIWWLLAVIWMGVIFRFSAQNGEQSSSNNKFVIEIFKYLGINLEKIIGSNANFIIRKLAHMTEYFILFHLLYKGIFNKYNFWKASCISIILVFLYACSDEFHQSFMPGRGPSFRDVLIDTSGGGTALISRVIVRYKRSLASKNKNLLKK